MNEKLQIIWKKFRTTGFFAIFGSNVIIKIINFLSSIILVHLVSKAAYGAYSYAWNIFSIFYLLSGLGAISATLQLSCERPHDEPFKKAIYSFSCRFGSFVNVFLCIAIFLIGLFVPFTVDGVGVLLCCMGLLPLVQYWGEYQSIYLRAERRNREFSILNVVSSVLILLFSIIGSFFAKEQGFIYSRYIAGVLLIMIGIKVWKVPLSFRKVEVGQETRRAFLSISVISMMNNGLSQLLYLLDVFILGLVVPDGEVIASYKIATIIPTALSFVPQAVITYVYPYFSEHKDDGEWCLKRYKQLTIAMAGANLLIGIILLFGANFIITILYGSQYLDAAVPFRILSVSYFFSGTFRTIAGNLLVTQRKLGFNLFVAVFSGLLNIVFDIIFIKMLGSTGAAISTISIVCVTSLLNTLYLIHVFKKKTGNGIH